MKTTKHEQKFEQSNVTTQEAAHLLGISVTSVQQLVERGVLQAWKTQGGHRRIPRIAVNALKTERYNLIAGKEEKISSPGMLSLLFVENDPMQRMLYEKKIFSWGIPITIKFCLNGYQALIDIARCKYDIFLLDVEMEGIDGYQIVKAVLSNPDLQNIDIVAFAAPNRAGHDARGELPEEILFFPKPIVFDELRGYFRACAAHKARQSRKQPS